MDIKTVDGSSLIDKVDPLCQRQREGVAKMRTSLLACTDESCISTRQAIQSITAMRIYHQLARIVKYLELMDKLENKMYAAIEYTVDTASESDSNTWVQLVALQERLQKSMIESHKMLQPYLDLQEFSMVDLVSQETESPTSVIMSSEARDKLRTNAQAILTQLQDSGGDGNAIT